MPRLRGLQAEILLLPVTAVYSLALLVAAGPAAALAGAAGARGALMTRRQRWAVGLREKWLQAGPHLVVVAATSPGADVDAFARACRRVGAVVHASPYGDRLAG